MARRALDAPTRPYKPLKGKRDHLNDIYARYRQSSAARHLAHGSRFVPGEGSIDPTVLFVAEFPSANEAHYARSGVGYLHVLLNLIQPIGLEIHDVHITHLAKYRPKNPRRLRPVETSESVVYLHEEIRLLAPKVIVPWGITTTKALLPAVESLAHTHGVAHVNPSKVHCGGATIVPSFHPALVLGNPSIRKVLTADMNIIKENI